MFSTKCSSEELNDEPQCYCEGGQVVPGDCCCYSPGAYEPGAYEMAPTQPQPVVLAQPVVAQPVVDQGATMANKGWW